MLLNIVLIIFIAISLLIMFFIVIKKVPQLKIIDPEELDVYKEEKIKRNILNKKFKRDVDFFYKKILQILKPISNHFSKNINKLYKYLHSLEHKYRTKLVKTYFDDKISLESQVLIHMEKADDFLKNKEFNKAETEYIDALKIDVHNLDIYKKLADLYFQNKDYDKAKETYEYILRIKEDDYSYSRLGDISKNRGDLNQAINNYSKSVAINSNNPMHYYNLAKINLKLEKIEDSLNNINRALNMESDNPKFLDFLLDLSIIMKDKDLANKTFRRLKESNPDNNRLLEIQEKINNI